MYQLISKLSVSKFVHVTFSIFVISVHTSYKHLSVSIDLSYCFTAYLISHLNCVLLALFSYSDSFDISIHPYYCSLHEIYILIDLLRSRSIVFNSSTYSVGLSKYMKHLIFFSLMFVMVCMKKEESLMDTFISPFIHNVLLRK